MPNDQTDYEAGAPRSLFSIMLFLLVMGGLGWSLMQSGAIEALNNSGLLRR